jgi:hypothetical protein
MRCRQLWLPPLQKTQGRGTHSVGDASEVKRLGHPPFSKKLENHGHMVALYFMHYNFCRVHKTLRVTPAMEAGIADHVWEIEDLLQLLEV